MTENVLTTEFRVSFPHVFKPQSAAEGAEPKYSLSMLFPVGTDVTALKKAAADAAKEKWGDNLPKKLKSPFLDQGDYEYDGYEEGGVLIRATSKQKPGLVDAKVQAIIDESEFYPGCYARATVRAFAYDVSGNKGVSFGLQNLQKTRDGEMMGGRTRAATDFDAYGDGGDEAGAGASADELFS